MAKIKSYYKLKGETLYRSEADAALENYTVPTGYKFLNWSSSSTENVAVDFSGDDVRIEANATYYPVIKTSDLLGWELPSPSEYTGHFEHSVQGFFGGRLFSGAGCASTSGWTDEVSYLTDRQNYIMLCAMVDSTYVDADTWRYRDIADFGMVKLSDLTAGVSGFVTVSAYTGVTYYLKIVKDETDNGNTYPYSFRLYIKLDDKMHALINKMHEEIPSSNPTAAQMSYFKDGDVILIGQLVGAWADHETPKCPAGFGIDYNFVFNVYDEI